MTRFLNGLPVRDQGKKKRPRSPPSKRDARAALGLVSVGDAAGAPAADSGVGQDDDQVLSDEELNATVTALQTLNAKAHLLGLARFKALRTVLFDLTKTPPPGHSLVARISSAVSEGRWRDALSLLRALRASGEIPKLGSVQRWVRDCDVTSVTENDSFRVVDLILRITCPEQIGTLPCDGAMDDGSASATVDGRRRIIYRPPWIGGKTAPLASRMRPADVDAATALAVKGHFRVVLHEAAEDRRPPNLHDMIIYTDDGNVCQLAPPSAHLPVAKVHTPNLPMTFMLRDVFSEQEASAIIRAAEAVGFHADVPKTDKHSVLAYNFVWVPHANFMRTLFSRCMPLLPPTLNGDVLYGINSRFRCYRYTPGAVYRAHVDGAWPPAGLTEDGTGFVADVAGGAVISRLTMLMYLNEGFEGGHTTFFTPSQTEGILDAFPVVPCLGCVMLFPHGDTCGTLVHEGSAVTSGVKYIIRTEVLYTKKSKPDGDS